MNPYNIVEHIYRNIYTRINWGTGPSNYTIWSFESSAISVGTLTKATMVFPGKNVDTGRNR